MNGGRRQALLPGQRPLRGAHINRRDIGQQLLVEPDPRALRAAEEERQPIQRHLAERRLARGPQPQADRRLHAALLHQSEGGQRRGRADIFRLRQFERQQLHRMGGAELAVGLVLGAELAAQLGAARQGRSPAAWRATRRRAEAAPPPSTASGAR